LSFLVKSLVSELTLNKRMNLAFMSQLLSLYI